MCVICTDPRRNSNCFLYSINWVCFITETDCVYCAVRTEPLNIIWVNFSLQTVNKSQPYSFCVITE
jgi:hypothetical protein